MGVNAKASLEAPASKELGSFFKSKASSTLCFQIAKAQCKVLSLLRCSANPASVIQSEVANPALQKLQDSGSTGKTSKHALELPKFAQGISIS